MKAKGWEVNCQPEYDLEREVYAWRHEVRGGPSPTLRISRKVLEDYPAFAWSKPDRIYDKPKPGVLEIRKRAGGEVHPATGFISSAIHRRRDRIPFQASNFPGAVRLAAKSARSQSETIE